MAPRIKKSKAEGIPLRRDFPIGLAPTPLAKSAFKQYGALIPNRYLGSKLPSGKMKPPIGPSPLPKVLQRVGIGMGGAR